jgi:heat shock protein HslJ
MIAYPQVLAPALCSAPVFGAPGLSVTERSHRALCARMGQVSCVVACRRRWLLLFAIGALVACQDGRSAGPSTGANSSTTGVLDARSVPTRGQDVAALMERSFVGTSASESGHPRPFGAGTTVRVRFQGGGLRYTVGCNSMAAWVDLNGGRLVLRDGTSTLVGCGGSLGEDEAWLYSFMEDQPQWHLQDTHLTLTTANSVLRLLDRRVAEPNRSLEQPTRWLLRSVTVAGSTAVVPADKLPMIEFVGGRFFGGTTCNDFSGNVVMNGDSLFLSGLQVGPIPCTEPMATIERGLLALLDGPVDAKVSGDTLVINNGGAGRAEFLAQDDGY